MKIETARFLLRDFEPNDRTAFARYHADPRFAALPGQREAPESDALFDLFTRWALEQPRRNFQLAALRKGDPAVLIGCCGLRGADCPEGMAELGIELSPDAWSRHGYAAEIAQALLRFGFRERGLQSVFGLTTAQNRRAARLAEWFGGGVMEDPAAAGDQVRWVIRREDWRETPRL